MIRGSQLVGRAVVDMDAAERLGKVKEIIVQRDGERVAGFVVTRGESLLGGGGTRRIIPASALNAIGPDAITVHGAALQETPTTELDELPCMSDVIGHKMVTRSGRLIGSIDDILIDGNDGTIIGFAVGEGIKSKLENVFSPERSRLHGYVRADADLHVGNDLIVVPDDALIEGEPGKGEAEKNAPRPTAENVAPSGWSENKRSKSERNNLWRRRAAAANAPGDMEKSGQQTGETMTPRPDSSRTEIAGTSSEDAVNWGTPARERTTNPEVRQQSSTNPEERG
jgi:uncharacterized protein YrrD